MTLHTLCLIIILTCYLRLIFRAKARPSKKAKTNNQVDVSNSFEPERTLEPSNPNAGNTPDDPSPQDHAVFAGPMGIDLSSNADNPPSPTKVADDNTDDVMVTGVSYTAPGNPTALSKHSAKEEFSVVDKGKWKADLESYARFSAQDIHSGFLNRLYTSRDYEASLLNIDEGAI